MIQDRFRCRVWDKRKNNYIEDFVFNFINKSPYITIEYFDNEYAYTHTFEEDEIIIEQCTGLKDKNGKLIYEGDIFEADVLNSFDGDEFIGKRIRGQVSWFDIESCFSFASYQPSDLFEIEVIGNIHENKNLLENK